MKTTVDWSSTWSTVPTLPISGSLGPTALLVALKNLTTRTLSSSANAGMVYPFRFRLLVRLVGFDRHLAGLAGFGFAGCRFRRRLAFFFVTLVCAPGRALSAFGWQLGRVR